MGVTAKVHSATAVTVHDTTVSQTGQQLTAASLAVTTVGQRLVTHKTALHAVRCQQCSSQATTISAKLQVKSRT